MKFFGSGYAYDWDEPKVETPVGAVCGHCGEPIAHDDGGCLLPCVGLGESKEIAYHHTCFMRTVIGSVAHQQRRCMCYVPGSTEEDDPTLTRRQAAEAARAFFESRN